MNDEKIFKKYEIKGADYHYKQINKSNRQTFNSYVYARYQLELKILSLLIKRIPKKGQQIRILDLGCGDGVIFHLFNKIINQKSFELYGIDSNQIAIETARKRVPNATFELGNVLDLPFEDNMFDVIITADVIEHISDLKQMLSEIKRVGKNKSYLVLGTPTRFTEFPFDNSHVKEFFVKEYEMLLKSHFKVLKIIQSHELVYFLLYERPFKILGRNRYFIRNLIDFITIKFDKNPFMKVKENEKGFYSYMFAMCKITK